METPKKGGGGVGSSRTTTTTTSISSSNAQQQLMQQAKKSGVGMSNASAASAGKEMANCNDLNNQWLLKKIKIKEKNFKQKK